MRDAARIRSDVPLSSAAPLGRAAPERRGLGGFGLPSEIAGSSREQLGRAVLTMLLVLYPAAASVAVIVAAFMLQGAGTV
jgi:hypothetical protein